MPLKIFQPQEARQPGKIQHIVGVAAGKGGVGKSTVTVNLALALKKAGYSVGVMDMDIYGPSVRKMLPEDEVPEQKDGRILPAICKGIRMISMAYFRRENEAAAVRAPIANGIVSQFIKQVDWGVLDFLLIDFPPGTGDIQLTLCQQANLSGAVVVTTPQDISVMDVKKAVHLFEHTHVPVIGVIENMSYFVHPSTGECIHVFGKNGGEHLSQAIGAPFLGKIPIDPMVCQCCDEGVSLFDKGGDSSAAIVFNEIAESVVAHTTALKRLSQECLGSFELQWKEMP